jgi:coenzyme F420 hydrogenase subunit beta
MNKKYTIDDIVNQDLCTGCGICVSESPESLKMEWDKYGFFKPRKIIKAALDYEAIKVCPFNPCPDKEVEDEDKLANIFLNEATYNDKKIGRFENTYVGYANKYRKTSSSGGIATYVFTKLLEAKVVDYLFIVKEINGSYGYQLFNKIEEIVKISKTRYIPVTLEDLFIKIDEIDGKIAISGVACFIKAIRLKQHYYPELKAKIPFLVGIICGGLKSAFFTDYLAQKAGIEGLYSRSEYRIKDSEKTASDYSYGAFDDKNDFHQIKMSRVGDMWGTGLFKSNACDFCDDVTTELADISLGDAWLEPFSNDGSGTSVIISRSKLADSIIQEGIENNNLAVQSLSVETFKLSQKGSFNHRNVGMKYRLDLRIKNGFIIPFKRKRLLVSSPLEFKIVQKYRMEVRDYSLKAWKETQNSDQFDNRMFKIKKKLFDVTLLYHRIQRLKRILKLRTM